MRELAERLSTVPGVVAVTLGGSRAGGTVREDGDWVFGLYYRGDIRAEDVRALGFEGTVGEAGELGRIANGGARLVIDGQLVELLYRSLDTVEHWLAEAEAGRFEIDRAGGYVGGLPSYVLVGELAMCEVLHGELPRPTSPRTFATLRLRTGVHSRHPISTSLMRPPSGAMASPASVCWRRRRSPRRTRASLSAGIGG